MKRSRLLLGIVFLIFLTSCLSWFLEKPTFALKELEIKRLSFKEIDLLLGIEVQNPNNFELKLRALEYTIYLNDQAVGQGRLEKEIKIAKSSSTMVPMPLQIDLKNLSNPLELILAGKDWRYKIEGAAVIKASLGSATVPFSKSGEIKIKK